MELFKPLPENLADLTDDALGALVTEHVATLAAIKKNDPDTLGDLNAQQILDASKAGKDAYATLKAEQAKRVEAEATYTAEIESLTADIPELAETPEGEGGEGDGGDAPAEPETLEAETVEEIPAEEVVTAAVRRPALPTPSPRHQPLIVTEPQDSKDVALVASINANEGREIRQGDLVYTRQDRDVLLAAAINQTRGAQGRFTFARANWKDKIPGDRTLSDKGAGASNTAKILDTQREVYATAEALVASAGQGNCAPLTPYYTLQDISTAARPVRDALTGYAADRGGITYMPPPALSTMADNGAVGIISEADQAEGGTFATKTCAVITCSEIVSVQVDQIYKCLQFGNLQSRAYPEFVAHDNNLAIAQWAREADTDLLDTIKAGSTQVTGLDQATQSAVNNYFGDLFQAAAGIRSYNRMPLLAPLQAIAPGWLRDLLVLDIARGQFDRFEYAQAQIDALLARYGINMAWTLDGSSNGSQVFGVQNVGALNSFPATAETAIFPPGTWLFLDAGTLDLGIVRDSVLNAINAYQLFAETFEKAAKVGVVSYWLTSTICPNGAVALPADSSVYC